MADNLLRILDPNAGLLVVIIIRQDYSFHLAAEMFLKGLWLPMFGEYAQAVMADLLALPGLKCLGAVRAKRHQRVKSQGIDLFWAFQGLRAPQNSSAVA